VPAENARWANSMLRIETHQTQNQLTFRVAGKLCGASVAALEECWRAAQSGTPRAEEAIDLTDVTSIDKAGWSLLQRMYDKGVKFTAKGLTGQTILDELAGKEERRA
jgi:ABC-type transporter Mla MlaB component